jgi:hypothetical protein
VGEAILVDGPGRRLVAARFTQVEHRQFDEFLLIVGFIIPGPHDDLLLDFLIRQSRKLSNHVRGGVHADLRICELV